MNKITIRKIIIAFAIFITSLAIIYAAIYILCKKYLNITELQKMVATRGQEILHRDITIGSKLDFLIDWSFTPIITVYDVTISNLPHAHNSKFLTAKSVQLQVDLSDFLFKKINITGLIIQQPDIYLETVNGVNNWDFDIRHNEKKNTITVKEINIIDGNVTYFRNDTIEHKLILHTLDVSSNSSNTYFDFTIDGTYDKKTVKAEGSLALNSTEYKCIIDNLVYNDVDLKGQVRIKPKAKEIAGEFKSNSIDLNTLLDLTPSNPSGEYSIPNTPIPVDFLRDSKISFLYSINNFTFHGFNIKDLALNITTNDNKIHFTFDHSLKIAKGKATLSLAYNLKDAPPSMNFSLSTSNIDFETFMHDLAGKSPITGGSVLDIRSELKSFGATYADLVNNLSGKILITASSGTYLNGSADIQNIIANVLSGVITFEKSQANTTFTCGVMNFKVNDGVAVANRGVAIEAASVNVLGNGRVDLRNGRIAFSIVPKNVNPINAIDITKFSMAQAASINGTISKPVVTFNAGNLINTGNVIGAATLATIGWQLGIAAVAKDAVLPSTEDNVVAPCKTALAN